MKSLQKIAIKVGTSTLTQGSKKLSRRFMLQLAMQMVSLIEAGHQVVLISSGAIAAGKEVLAPRSDHLPVPLKQMYAAIGQVELMHLWKELFLLFEIHVAQLLLTGDDFSHRKRYLNARDTLCHLLSHHVLPIINENDTTATREIRVGDNDNLAAYVANLIGADLLILLTDQAGLFEKDPRVDPEAKLIKEVLVIDESIDKMAKGSKTKLGTGGMATKIQAARIAVQSGIPTVIASAAEENVLLRIVAHEPIGTRFHSQTTQKESRKRWLISEKKQGQIFVDEGAAVKIVHHGASLLPSGIHSVEGSFDRGAIVHILSGDEPIACGITNYNDAELKVLIGSHSTKIEDLLGYTYGDEVIHRTNMTRIKLS